MGSNSDLSQLDRLNYEPMLFSNVVCEIDQIDPLTVIGTLAPIQDLDKFDFEKNY